VSLELLTESERIRFEELAAVAEDAEIPVDFIARLWAEAGGLAAFETEDLLSRLSSLSLLLDLDLQKRILRLHDTVRHFLQAKVGKDGLLTLHKRLLPALEELGASAVAGPLQRYYFLYLPYHLDAALDRARLDALLLDPKWLKSKLEATGNAAALIADYEFYGQGAAQSLIGRTLRLTAGICARDPRQLLPQLIGRLMQAEPVAATGFFDAARLLISPPAILPTRPGLSPPGAEVARLEGHSSAVSALCMLPDGRLASGSFDNTILLWDLASGAEAARLEGHSSAVLALCMLPDGRLASGSYDNTIRLWDLASGAETARLEGHSGLVYALCRLPDERLASGYGDSTIRLWDVASGAEIARLEGHSNAVSVLCLLPDGRLASGSWDNTIRLWDLASGAETARLEGHSLWVSALCRLPDGRLASGSVDKTIRLWDLASGAETARLEFDATVECLISTGGYRLVAGDRLGRLHWLEILT
jgi:WD40 repeat protein